MGLLDDLHVIDLSNTITGAQVSQLLSDFGAEVVHVEPPGGSGLRAYAAYPFWARGKKSIELDLKSAEDQAVARCLAEASDVLIETYRPGVTQRLGLDFETLHRANPRLVYASITGFGQQGPYADVKGYEGVVMAKLGGFQVFQQMSLRPGPTFSAMPWCSYAASQTTLHGVLSALYERERSGLGQLVEANLAQSFVALDSVSWFLHLIGERFPDAYQPVDAFEDGVPNSVFAYFVMAAMSADGEWLQFSQARPHLFKAFMEALGLDWMFQDPAWAGIPVFEDAGRRTRLWELMLEAVRKRTFAEWQEVFDVHRDVWAEQFRRGPDVLTHPQLEHDGYAIEITDPERGPVRQPGPLVRLERTPAVLDRSAPARDEHGTDIRATVQARSRPAPTDSTSAPAGDLPLAGVTVLELAYLLAAPYGATVLTDLGARVIKIEPFEGDPIRQMIPFPEAGGAKFMQGKESICIDLNTLEGQEIVQRVAARADLVLQSFRPGVAERLHLDAGTLTSVNPDLVYLNAYGYGADGPCADRPAFAPCIGAAAGISRVLVGDTVPSGPELSMEEVQRGSIVLAGASATMNAQSDGLAALSVGTALLLGLVARQRRPPAQGLMTTMLSSVTHAVSVDIVDHPGRTPAWTVDDDLMGVSARYRLYEASEGWVFLAAPTEEEWPALVKALAPTVDLTSDPRFATEDDRRRHDTALATVLAEAFVTQSDHEWEQQLLAADVACVAVHTGSVESVMWSEEFGRAAGYVVDVEHPTFDEHPRLAPLVRFSRSATQALPGCLAGQHTDALLRELGYDDTTIASLRQRQIVA